MTGRRGFGFEDLSTATLLAVAAAGFGAASVAGVLRTPLLIAAVAAAVVSFREDRRLRVPPAAWNLLAAVFLAWCALRWTQRDSLLRIGGDLLAFVQVNRIESRSTHRDRLSIVIIAFGQILLASILTIHPLWLVGFLAFLVGVTWALLLLRLQVDLDAAADTRGDDRGRERYRELDGLLTLRFGAAITGTALAIAAATGAFFFLLPRFQLGVLQAAAGPAVHVAGFSSEVRLGEVGLLQLRRDPVMRVKVKAPAGVEPPRAPFYMAGLALDRFDGRRWSLSSEQRIPLRAGGPTWPPPARPLHGTDAVFEVSLEPLDAQVLFVAGRPLGLYGPFRALEAAVTEGYWLPGPPSRREYAVHAVLARPSPASLRAGRADVPAEVADQYLALPGISERTRALAERLRVAADTPYDRALAVEQHLARGEYRYSLDLPSSLEADPVDAFLFARKEGHCEYFATAMAVLLRVMGVPSRVVNGFLVDDYSEAGGYWLVRQSDAHSWVEAWLPGAGWQRFDPTPGAGASGSARLRLAARLGQYADLFQERWNRVVLDYDIGAQFTLWSGLGERLGGLSARVPSPDARPPGPGEEELREARRPESRRGIGWAVAAGCALLAAWAGSRRILARAREPGADRLPPGAPRRYRRLVERAARLANRVARPADGDGATLREALAAAEDADPEGLAGLSALADRYYAARFGARLPDDGDVADARRLVAALARSARKPGPSATRIPPPTGGRLTRRGGAPTQ